MILVGLLLFAVALALVSLFCGNFWASLAVILFTCGFIYLMHILIKKYKYTFKEKLVLIVAIILGAAVIIGAFVLAINGANDKSTSYSYSSTQCGYCGGSGVISSGKLCPLCDGWGGAYRKNAKSGNTDLIFLCLLMVDAGGAILMSVIAEKTDIL